VSDLETAAETQAPARPTAPALGVVVASFVLALIGLGIASYLTYEHFTGSVTLSCVGGGAFNCLKVTTSAQSHFLGIPVAVLGLAYFVVAVPMYSPWAWWSRHRAVHLVRIAMAAIGMLMVLWLVSAELLIIHSLCAWCTGVHVITFLLFVLTLTSAPGVLERDDLVR
jgi:uncharacterized membrane protein